MKVPLSWIKEFVEIDLSPEETASRLTFGGMEVEEIEYVGLSLPAEGERRGFKISGLGWDPARIVVAQILEVKPHPNADRLTLLRLDDGSGTEQTVLTGAPNLLRLKDGGPLPAPIKVAYAREGAVLYDGHQPGRELMTLKRAKIRGVESYSMVCSEKELGLSDEHEGIIVLDDDAPVGQPLAGYMGDVVFTLKTNPNMARNINVLGVAREIAALTGRKLKAPDYSVAEAGPAIAGRAALRLETPELNPRFCLRLIEGVTIGPSPYHVQRRLRLCGVRPINNIVDATNYAMLEIGQPLHAFDYDVLVKRAGGQAPTIITRLPRPGETVQTLDEVTRKLDDFTILVCDTAGVLSLGGVMGGAESEVSEQTVNVLLEGAAWNFINIRRTLQAQKLSSEAGYRFSRGVHPAMAPRGVDRGIEYMRRWAGGQVAAGRVDEYPRPAPAVTVEITSGEVERLLGIQLSARAIAEILTSLEFECQVAGEAVRATAPDHRLDIGDGVVGQADLIEEIARIYGYERIPERRMSDSLPPQIGNRSLELEERARDLLVNAGLQEVITYSLIAPENERRLGLEAEPAYVGLLNPMAADRAHLRRSLLNSVLEVTAANSRARERQALFEIGAVYLPRDGQPLPDEPRRAVIVLTGPRDPLAWQGSDQGAMDFFDLKGRVEALMQGLHVAQVTYEPGVHPAFLPGRTAQLCIAGRPAGWLGELHPVVRERYELPPAPTTLAADLDLEMILDAVDERYEVQPVPAYPPVKEDIAVTIQDGLPAERVAAAIAAAGGSLLTAVTLFDLYRGDQIGAGRKSLAYRLTFQAPDRTLTDSDVARVRAKIVKQLKDELGAELRG